MEIVDYYDIPQPPPPYRAGMAAFTSKTGEWPHGSILALWRGPDTLVWTLRYDGSFTPHSIGWFDANADGRFDLFLLAGEEDVFNSAIYVNRLDSDATFSSALLDDRQYLTVLDLDKDSRPEFLGSAFEVQNSTMEDDGPCGSLEIPASVEAVTLERYHRFNTVSGSDNFTYGMPEYGSARMHLIEPLAIWHIEGSSAVDVTSKFREEAEWRLGVIDSLRRAGPPAECVPILDTIAKQLQKILQ